MWKHGWGKAMFRACHWEDPCCILFVPRESPSCFLWSWPVWRSAHIFPNTWLKGNTIKSLKVTLREVRVWSFPFLFLDASENASGPKRREKDILISFVASCLSRVPVTGSALKHPFYISLRWLTGPQCVLSGAKVKCIRKALTMLILKQTERARVRPLGS